MESHEVEGVTHTLMNMKFKSTFTCSNLLICPCRIALISRGCPYSYSISAIWPKNHFAWYLVNSISRFDNWVVQVYCDTLLRHHCCQKGRRGQGIRVRYSKVSGLFKRPLFDIDMRPSA